MEELIKISDVSKALGIPASTLRYWDKQGLLRFKRSNSNYREFSFETMLDICNVMLLRDLEVPSFILKKREEMTIADLEGLFSETKDDLIKKIEHLEHVLARISIREATLSRLKLLKNQAPTIVEKQLPPIQTFKFTNQSQVQDYLANPTQSADILDIHHGNRYTCGIFSTTTTTQLLRAGDQAPKKYLHGVTWHNKNQAPTITNLLAQANLTVAQIGSVIFQYLVSVHEDGDYRDYFEVWLEVESD